MDAIFQEKHITLNLSLRLYPLDAIYGACYQLIDEAYLYLDQEVPGRILVTVTPKATSDRSVLEGLAGRFENELLHQVLRLRLDRRTGRVRDMIVGRALLAAEPLLGPDSDNSGSNGAPDDYLDDPLGIAVPWEEKYGSDEGKNRTDSDEN
ncbi:MAG: His-Xaa-Ser system protein HxsD [Deltaproteobacteria bacterium]|nr:His-Xaa-Ser system protein HxsD [Deltaproteobacteria bacterium]